MKKNNLGCCGWILVITLFVALIIIAAVPNIPY
jgi:hypothetical protein